MGLDKKPTPPPKRVKEDGRREESGISPKDAPEMRAETTGEEAASHSEYETMETQVKEETRAEEDKVRDGITTVSIRNEYMQQTSQIFSIHCISVTSLHVSLFRL